MEKTGCGCFPPPVYAGRQFGRHFSAAARTEICPRTGKHRVGAGRASFLPLPVFVQKPVFTARPFPSTGNGPACGGAWFSQRPVRAANRRLQTGRTRRGGSPARLRRAAPLVTGGRYSLLALSQPSNSLHCAELQNRPAITAPDAPADTHCGGRDAARLSLSLQPSSHHRISSTIRPMSGVVTSA